MERATGESEGRSGAEKDPSFHHAWLVELRNEPIELGRDANEDLADDVQKFSMLGIDRAMAACASGEEEFAVPGFNE